MTSYEKFAHNNCTGPVKSVVWKEEVGGHNNDNNVCYYSGSKYDYFNFVGRAITRVDYLTTPLSWSSPTPLVTPPPVKSPHKTHTVQTELSDTIQGYVFNNVIEPIEFIGIMY